MKRPDDRPSTAKDFGSFLGHLFTAFDESAIRRSIAIMQIKDNDRVLSVGYAPELLDALAKAAPHGLVEAVDSDEKTIEKARKKYADAINGGHFNLAEGSETQMPFARDFFDCIVAIDRFERWMEPSRRLPSCGAFCGPTVCS